MARERRLGVKPRRRPDVSGFDAPVEKSGSQKEKKPSSPSGPAKAPAKTPAKPAAGRAKAPSKAPAKPGSRAAKAPAKSPTTPRTDPIGARDVPEGESASRARRRVHVTVDETVAAAVRSRVSENGESNTQILIEAYMQHAAKIAPDPAKRLGPFAPRGRVGRRDGVYFYLSADELAHIDEAAESGGFETRSGFIDSVLKAHLVVE